MSEEKDNSQAQGGAEDSIKVICRFRPLNDTEEKTGSKIIIKFPSGSDDQCVSIGVSLESDKVFDYSIATNTFNRAKSTCSTKY